MEKKHIERVSIASPDHIESGEYYEDARDWYASRYILPFTERSYYILLSIVSIIVICILVVNILALFPVTQRVPLLNTIDNFARQYSVIRSIEDQNLTINQSLALYLVSKYVASWEEYHAVDDKISSQFYFVYNNSSASLARQFQAATSASNPNSPVVKYGREKKRLIDITDVQFDNNPTRPETLIVNYRATLYSVEGEKSTDWQAIVSFNLSDPILSLYNDIPFEFTVTSYDTTQL